MITYAVDVRPEFKIEDMWLGLYWKKGKRSLDLWVCLIPCIPLHIHAWKERTCDTP